MIYNLELCYYFAGQDEDIDARLNECKRCRDPSREMPPEFLEKPFHSIPVEAPPLQSSDTINTRDEYLELVNKIENNTDEENAALMESLRGTGTFKSKVMIKFIEEHIILKAEIMTRAKKRFIHMQGGS